MAVKVKIGLELDDKAIKSQFDSTLKSFQNQKIKLNIDLTQIKEMQKAFNELSKSMNNLKMPNINTGNASAVKQTSDAIKQQNADLKSQQSIYQNLRASQNEKYNLEKQLITASGQHKEVLQEQLSKVNEQYEGYRKQAQEISNIGNNSQKLLQIDQQREVKTRELVAAQEKYNTSMNSLKQNAINNINTNGLNTQQVDEYKRRLEAINTVSMSQVKAEIKSIGSEFDKQRVTVETYGKTLTNIGNGMQTVGRGLLTAFAIPTAGIVAGTKSFATFSQEMSKVKAVSNLTNEEFRQLNDLAKQLGLDTMYSAKTAASAMTDLAKAGFGANEIMSLLPTTLDLAAASGEDVSVASNMMATGMRAFGLVTQDANQNMKNSAMFADVLASAANASAVDIRDLSESFKFAAPLANSLGYSIQDVGFALGVLGNQSIKGECLPAQIVISLKNNSVNSWKAKLIKLTC